MKRHPEDDPIGHLTNPIVTGGAIIALRCREGVVIATDTLLSYGGLLSIPSLTLRVSRRQSLRKNRRQRHCHCDRRVR